MNKEIEYTVKIQISSQEASPTPPIGPILGQKGINIMKFCNEFNLITKEKNIEKGLIIPVIINIYTNKMFDFILKNPPVSILIKKKIKLKSGSNDPGKNIIGYINIKDIEEIATLKIYETNTLKIKSFINSIIGTAKSMGVKINY